MERVRKAFDYAARSSALALGGLAILLGKADAPGAGSPPTATYYLDAKDLSDPASCEGCHPNHAAQWSSSAHANAARDPIFVAMQRRAEREMGGMLGAFCTKCHAPEAARAGVSMASLPASKRGVTCVSCHTIDRVDAVHDARVHRDEGGAMRGPVADPIANAAHGSSYSPLHDRDRPESAELCGSCHDLRTEAGAPIESTYAEWHTSLYAKPDTNGFLSCAGCHMDGKRGRAADVPDAPERRVHDHTMAGVDALAPDAKEDVAKALDRALTLKLCVHPPRAGTNVDVAIDAAFVGHAFPSGAAHNRRVWLELEAFVGASVVARVGSGVNAIGSWSFGGELLDARGAPVHFVWQAASARGSVLTAATTSSPLDPGFDHASRRSFRVPTEVDRIEAVVRMTPVAREVLDDLVASGDLSPEAREAVPVYTLASTRATWTAARGFGCVP